MHYLVAGIFKPCSEDQVVALRNEWNEHLTQPNRTISLLGLLRDKEGKRQGYIAFIEAESFEEAEQFMHQSPFYSNKLYERVEVAEFQAEVGDFAQT